MTDRIKFPALHHGNMLGDSDRLSVYKQAIDKFIKNNMVVVDIGTGTGVLAALAARQTHAPVIGIEYFKNTAAIAIEMSKKSSFKNIEILNARSYDVTLGVKPNVLITETIGRVGPEENIVEICYDFKRRHPTIQQVLPSSLSLFAELVVSDTVKREEEAFLRSYVNASFDSYCFQNIKDTLLWNFSSEVHFSDLSKDQFARTTQNRVCLAEYKLGETFNSSFSQEMSFIDKSEDEFNCVHLYFEAKFDESLILSTHRTAPLTHWKHAYIYRPNQANRLRIFYVAPSQVIGVEWIQ